MVQPTHPVQPATGPVTAPCTTLESRKWVRRRWIRSRGNHSPAVILFRGPHILSKPNILAPPFLWSRSRKHHRLWWWFIRCGEERSRERQRGKWRAVEQHYVAAALGGCGTFGGCDIFGDCGCFSGGLLRLGFHRLTSVLTAVFSVWSWASSSRVSTVAGFLAGAGSSTVAVFSAVVISVVSYLLCLILALCSPWNQSWLYDYVIASEWYFCCQVHQFEIVLEFNLGFWFLPSLPTL
jgi:hypothetical protein